MKTKFYMINHDNELTVAKTIILVFEDQFFFKRRCRYATIKTIFILCLLPGPINFD